MKSVVSTNAQGVVTVNGRAYPMAGSVVATEEQIQTQIRATAQRIASDYKDLTHRDTTVGCRPNTEAIISDQNPLLLVSILKGSYIFTADLVRYLGDVELPNVVDFVRLASYNAGTESTGNVQLLTKPSFTQYEGKHVLLVEDICDSGRSLQFFCQWFQTHYRPKSLKVVVLANKPVDARRVPFEVEYACLNVPNQYVVGYGFEVNDRYRNYRHIFCLRDGESGRYPAKL